jgi:uncharacterized protein YndB with AHSA1/START domain
MTVRERYSPGPAAGEVRKDGETWTLVLVRQLRHSPEKVWQALTDPAQLREWAPFDADRNLDDAGATVRLATVGAPAEYTSDATISRAEAPKLLEYNWGGGTIRWELEPADYGTRLTLSHNIDRRFVAMGAAGWHLCIDVMDHMLAGTPMGRIVANDAMQFDGWYQLHAGYQKLFGVESPRWGQ